MRFFLAFFASVVTLCSVFFLELRAEESPEKRLRVLHLSFHRGCIHEFSMMGKQLGLNVESWFIPDLPDKFFDGVAEGNALYNVTHERAERIWEKHKKVFEKFDAILVSDTAPLSRIFLQNKWKKPLIIWVCNRFDYYDRESLDGDFPDAEFYELFRNATKEKNVFILPYTAFERHYASKKNVEIDTFVIAPCCPELVQTSQSRIPESVVKEETFFLPPYLNETQFIDLSTFCAMLGIKTYCGRYSSPRELERFKGIIHLPYNWSNLSFFENTMLGVPYFIPSQKFLEELLSQDNYFHADLRILLEDQCLHLSEWYSPAHADIITYFDSWEDLRHKLETTDFSFLRRKVKEHSFAHYKTMLDRWTRVFQQVRSLPPIPREEVTRAIPSFVVGRLLGQLGNQFFMIAAAVSLALDHNAIPLFPDFTWENSGHLKDNYDQIFNRLNATPPAEEIEYHYKEPEFTYFPIPYHDNMEIRGWFQSEKYFSHHKKEILELFSPSDAILEYLHAKYADIIDHPNTVSIHVRSYLAEDPLQKVYINLDMDYYEAAMALFPKDTLFVVFSQHMDWCKENFQGRNVRFIEGEKYYHDLYLMALCKHNIIGNSTFSWWGAYLNKNPNKNVVAPSEWFSPSYNHDIKDLFPKEWTIIRARSPIEVAHVQETHSK